MAERWQTGELRVPPHAFRDSAGAPKTGLTPTATVWHVDGTANPPTATVVEIGGGGYRLVLSAAPTRSLFVQIDGGSSLTTTRYVFQDVPVGGYVDNLDAQVSVLTGRLTSARALLLDNLANLDVAVSTRATHAEATTDTSGTTTLLARLSALRAGYLDALVLLDVAVSTRAAATTTAHVEVS